MVLSGIDEPMIDISVVIVTYNCRDYVLDCLESVLNRKGPAEIEIILVDNASSDGTVEAVSKKFPVVSVIENKQNRWYRPALNQGIQKSKGRYVLLLNADTRLLSHDGLTKLAAYMDTHPQVGITGAKLFNADGTIQEDCERFPGLGWAICHYFFLHSIWPENPVRRLWRYGNWDRKDTRTVDTVSGACMMVRRQVFEQVGLFDERSLIYWEEPDFCRGAAKAGWQTVHLAEVEVLHYWMHGGVLNGPRQTLERMIEESMLNYYRKYYGEIICYFLLLLSVSRRNICRALKYFRDA